MALLFLLPLLGCAGLSTSDDESDADTDADTDADSDADTDADTDADSDTDTDVDADLTTYEGFVAEHASAYCESLESCEYLDERGYAGRGACVSSVTDSYLAASCDSYQEAAAMQCVRADVDMASACADSREGLEPLPCRDVCRAPA